MVAPTPSPPTRPKQRLVFIESRILKALIEKAVQMKLAFKLSILLSGIVSAMALTGLLYALAGLYSARSVCSSHQPS
jgi:cytochrome c-type biogenesis protein CcmH/NrfG